jgi:anti-anti-sigma factor
VARTGEFVYHILMDDRPLSIKSLPGQSQGQVILALKGPLTLSNLFGFQDAVRADKSPVLILDFSDVPYVDSAGLGSIICAHVSCSNSGRRLALAAVPDRVITMLHASRVDQVLAIFPTSQQAQDKLSLD